MKKILFWAGRGQNLKILENFRNELIKAGFKIEYINIKYDEGELLPNKWKQVSDNNADWWIGISLGAALLYYSANYAKETKKNNTYKSVFV